jgi:hypothetical protein
MNNGTNTTAPAQNASNEGSAQPCGYRPRLSFYHANGKGTGSAARFEAVPATGDRDGAVYLTLAQQKSVATGSAEQGNRQHATFDWQNRVTVKLNFGDLCQMLLVFKGQEPTIAGGKGLYHDSRNTTTLINLTRQTEPHPGFVLDVSRRGKTEAESAVRTRILFNGAEAYGLGAVLEQTLGLLAFGVPRGFRPEPASAPSETPPGDEPSPF